MVALHCSSTTRAFRCTAISKKFHLTFSLADEHQFLGTVYGTSYFLPILKREKRAHIVNLSSVFG